MGVMIIDVTTQTTFLTSGRWSEDEGREEK